MTEVLFALGVGDRVVGVSRGCDWPPAARRLPLVGDFSNVSGERVVALRPDLVVATGHEQSRIVAQLERFRLPVVAYMPADIAGVRRDILAVGDIVGKREEARRVLAAFDAELAVVDRRVAAVPYDNRPRVYLEISPEPLMTVARGSFVHEAIERAGGVNVGADLVRPYCRIDSEEVISANPDVIVSCHGGGSPAAIRARLGWSAIAAVRAGRVYDVDPDLVLRAGPRLSRGIATLNRLFYAPSPAGKGL
jgi:iron complex transport system substrate-binding protein